MKLAANAIAVMRGEDIVVDALSFDVASGEALLVKGENGAGKSTMLRAIAGLLPLEAGSLTIEGSDPDFAEATIAEQCHYLGHENAMKGNLSVGENLQFWQDFAGHPHLTILEALDMVGLDGLDSVPFAHLSTGQRRRASIARMLVSYRPIWLLDEPTAGLDDASSSQFAALMGAHLEDGGIVIAATHVPLHLEKTRELVLQTSTDT